MNQETELLKRLAKILENKGYAYNSINNEYLLKDNIRTDIALINPRTKQLLALIEIKRQKPNLQTKHKLISHLGSLIQQGVEVFIFYPDANSKDFQAERWNTKTNTFQNFDYHHFPSFSILNTRVEQQHLNSIQEKEKREDSLLRRLINLWMVLIAILFLGELYNCLPPLHNVQLILLGILLGLSLFPALHRIKILGIELEKLTRTQPTESSK